MPPDNGKSVFEHDSIHLDNVCFEYPDGPEVLSNISFAVKKGETVAIVGENGSGKSTLVRMLLGVYLPTNGAIYHNNVNTSDLQYSDMHKNISAVFQDFKKYKMTLEENVKMGDLSKNDRTKLLSSLNISGIDLSEKFDLETNLGREFGGIDLSIGEWQRVAIARGIYRGSDLIAFDEPTASIDPLQEYQLYKAFAEISQGKIAFIVTHRLSCIKFCDKIIVMRKGKVLDIGSHEKLLSDCPYYKTLWNSQAEMYTETRIG
jgi:ATP-binding cassette subfamily B protein